MLTINVCILLLAFPDRLFFFIRLFLSLYLVLPVLLDDDHACWWLLVLSVFMLIVILFAGLVLRWPWSLVFLLAVSSAFPNGDISKWDVSSGARYAIIYDSKVETTKQTGRQKKKAKPANANRCKQ